MSGRGGKVARWFERLTDEQIDELIHRIDVQMADTGQAPGPLRSVLVKFAANMPALNPAHQSRSPYASPEPA